MLKINITANENSIFPKVLTLVEFKKIIVDCCESLINLKSNSKSLILVKPQG